MVHVSVQCVHVEGKVDVFNEVGVLVLVGSCRVSICKHIASLVRSVPPLAGMHSDVGQIRLHQM